MSHDYYDIYTRRTAAGHKVSSQRRFTHFLPGWRDSEYELSSQAACIPHQAPLFISSVTLIKPVDLACLSFLVCKIEIITGLVS